MIEAINWELKNFWDLYLILIVCILVIVFSVRYAICMYQACNLPFAKNSKDFEKNFKVQFDGKYYFIKVLKRDYLFYKTYDKLHQKFQSKEAAWQFLHSDLSSNFLIEEVHVVMMIHRLRLFYQMEKSN